MTSYYDEQTFLTCRDFPLLARRVDSIRNWLSQGVRAPIHSHPNTPVVGPTRARATLSSHATYRLPHNPQLTFPFIQRNSCPTCRQQLLTLPGGGQLRELLEIRQEMSEHVRQLGGLLPLTDEQSEALASEFVRGTPPSADAGASTQQSVDDFVRDFRALRTTYHKRAIWSERWAAGKVHWPDDN